MSSSTSSAKFEVFRSRFGEPVGRKKAKDIATPGLSLDGSSSPSVSRRSTISGPVPTSIVGVQEDYADIEIPHDIDNRAA
jgi:hypothetical protein